MFDVDIGDGLPTRKLPYNVGGQFDTHDDWFAVDSCMFLFDIH